MSDGGRPLPGPLPAGAAMTVFFTSDSHFGDATRIRIDRRPFPTIAAQDAALVANWNAAVGQDDEVWHLGDFALRLDASALRRFSPRLHGRKHLITGNNDSPADPGAAGWASVAPMPRSRSKARPGALPLSFPDLERHGQGHGRPAWPQPRPPTPMAANTMSASTCWDFGR